MSPTFPWGIGGESRPLDVATVDLEPGDAILFYTDGAADGRGAAEATFGIERLSDLLGQATSGGIPPEQTVRALGRAVLDHHGGTLEDDATLVMAEWHGPTQPHQ